MTEKLNQHNALFDVSDSKEETVNITRKELEQLKCDSLFLNCLRANGVDNWDWYDELAICLTN